METRKLHFINRIDRENAGDWSCCPLNYYFDYFNQYNIIRHDIDFVDYNEIQKGDIVILGGSGMINVTESFNRAINRILNKCDHVIGWSIGFNTHSEQWYQGNQFPEINLDRFELLGIRDYMHPSGYLYLPCPSVMAFNPEIFNTITPIRKVGIIEHKDLEIACSSLYETIKHNVSMCEIQNFILSSEVIVTNSYHCAYWTILLKRRAVVVNKFSTKFDYFKYKPVFVNIDPLASDNEKKEIVEGAIDKSEVFLNAYEEAVLLNDNFFEKVKLIIERENIPRDKTYQSLYQLNCGSMWNVQNSIANIGIVMAKIDLIQEQINHLHDEVFQRIDDSHTELAKIINQLHDEVFQRIDDSHIELTKITNQSHDEVFQRIDDSHTELTKITNQLHDELYKRIDEVKIAADSNEGVLKRFISFVKKKLRTGDNR